MHRKLYLIPLLYTTALLISCGGGNPVGPEEPKIYLNNNTYINEKVKFKVTAPADWTLTMDVRYDDTVFPLVGEKNQYAEFQPNFNIYITEHAGTTDFGAILDIAEVVIENSFEDVKILSKNIVKVDGKDCGEMVYAASVMNIMLQQKQLYIIHNEHDIVFTFTDLQKHYSQNKGYFDQIQNLIELME